VLLAMMKFGRTAYEILGDVVLTATTATFGLVMLAKMPTKKFRSSPLQVLAVKIMVGGVMKATMRTQQVGVMHSQQ
jgi:hypothetical protein